MNITTIINYCSIEHNFIFHALRETKKFSEDIIVPFFDTLFSGEPEDNSKLEELKDFCKDNDIKFHEISYKDHDYFFNSSLGSRIGHNIARYYGFIKSKKLDYILFADADEIPEGDKVNELTKTLTDKQYKLANYWYFRSPRYQSKIYEDSIVLVNSKIVESKIIPSIYSIDERSYFLDSSVKRMTLGLDSLPTYHHFSWVRTQNCLLQKCKNWGHNKDKNWELLINEEFSRPFNGKDFVHNYEYNVVENKFRININE